MQILFLTWLTRIAINEALMWLRRKRNSPEVSIEDLGNGSLGGTARDFRDTGQDPLDLYLRLERKRFLRRALKQLSPRVRIAIEMRDLKEFSTQDTARILGLSPVAVKARLFNGRNKLRNSKGMSRVLLRRS